MEKVFVILEVPAISQQFEIQLPLSLRISDATRMLSQMASEQSGGLYISSNHEFLCLQEKNQLLKETATVSDYMIRNGSHLLLI